MALRFPLERQSDYKGTVQFRLLQDDSVDFGTTANSALGQIAETLNSNNDTGETTADDVAAHAGTNLQTVNPLTVDTSFSAGASQGRLDFSAGAAVILYLPPGLQFRDNVTYDNVDLGRIGATVEAGLKMGNGVMSSVGNYLSDMGSDLTSAIRSGISGNAGALIAQRLARNLGNAGQEVSSAISSVTQTTINPNTRVLFKQVPIREFTFQFKLIPESAQEAQSVKDIIKFFRTNLYPEELRAGPIAVGYKFPRKFNIRMQYDGREVATKILPSYLRDVSVTYNSQGMGFHSDGNFTDVEIALNFMEYRPLRKQEIIQGNY